MMSLDTGNFTDDFLSKGSASARRRRAALHRHKLDAKSTRVAEHGGGSGGEPNPSGASGVISGFGTTGGGRPNTTSSSSSSSTTPFRRMDGDIRREAGMPLSGDDIVERGNKARGVNCAAHGSISVIGRRRVMEDTLTVAPSDFPSIHDFFGAYDGHGGSRVSSACRDHLHRFVGEEIEAWKGQSVDWEIVMRDCFRKMDDEVNGEGCVTGGDVFGRPSFGFGSRVRTVGSTALAVVLGKAEIVVANCGDSRAVLYRNGEVVPLSSDHKPDRPDERHRVEAAGGKVIDVDGLRVLGVLKPTRSIGDCGLKAYMIPEPEVRVIKFSELDSFIIIGTNGLWDTVSNHDACLVVKKCLDGFTKRTLEGETTKKPAEAAAMLAELAMAKGSIDNISVIVIELRNRTHVT